ncbi:MAG TPA: class I SAM-dependent methyltransferase [Xanthobacteraceae bacterium]|nr:class I SAM-dependent methyltransferase [Xanthobacteraceae bacterium]
MFDTLRRHPFLVLSQVARDPLDSFTLVREMVLSRFESEAVPRYDVDLGWETDLHGRLGASSASADAEFWPLWHRVVSSLREKGVKVGPFSFHEWNDGDAGFVRAIWTLIRSLRPNVVVETGVAHGMTSRFILEALELNGAGHLWSVDLPPFNPESRQQVGIAVDGEHLRQRWTYVAGTSRRRLPALLAKLGQVDLFIHDSAHTDRNVTFELGLAWKYLSPGGAVIVDDVDVNPAFKTFAAAHPDCFSRVCTAEPLAPDPRRFNRKGLFGIALKPQPAGAAQPAH